jgi:uncharacterized RDD family membrane protein YckC
VLPRRLQPAHRKPLQRPPTPCHCPSLDFGTAGAGDLLIFGSLMAAIWIWLENETGDIKWLFPMALAVLYWPILESSTIQATPIARLMGLRITKLDGGRIGFRQAFWLSICRIAQWVLLPPLAWLFAGISPRRQTFANLLSGTLLLKRSADASDLRRRLPPFITAGGIVLTLLVAAVFSLPFLGLLANLNEVEVYRAIGLYPADEPLLSGSGGKP